MRIKTLFNGFIGIAVVMLVGCGGGGGGGSDPVVPSNINLGGTAAKGIIKGGNVVAEELNGSGTVVRQVGSATTIADGSYTLTVGNTYGGGPIQVAISADANTQMKCDVPAGCGTRSDGLADTVNPTIIDFGEWYKPGSLTMKALVAEAAANDTIGVNITPYTNMAASRAISTGTLDAAAVYNANSEVSVLLGGIDILSTKPLDITDVTAISGGDATEIAYAAFSAAIAALADTTSGASGDNPDINGALDSLSNSFSDGTIVADDGGTDPGISLQEIINGATSTLAQTGTGDTSGTLASMQVDVDGAGVGGSVDPEPSPSAGDTTLAKVKDFVTDVRTWGTVIDAEIGAKGDAFELQTDLASTAVDLSMDLLIGPAMDAALEAIGMNFDGTNTSTDLSTYVTGLPADSLYLGFPGDPQFTAGTIAKSGDVITITGGVINGVTVNINVQLPLDGTVVAAGTSLTIGINSASFRSAETDADINGGTITLNLVSAYTVDWTAIDLGAAATPDISGGSINLDVALTQKRGMDAMMTTVVLDSPVTFTGTLSATLTNPITDGVTDDITWITPSTLTLAGNVSDTAGNSLDANFTVNITNADTFTPVGELPFGTIKADLVTWAYTDVSPVDSTDDTFTLVSPEYTLTIQWASGTGDATVTENWGYGYGFTNNLSGGPFVSVVDAVNSVNSPLNWSLPYYIWVDGEGGYGLLNYTSADFSVAGSTGGSLIDPDFVVEDVDNWLAGTVGLDFVLQLAGLPEASVNINGTRTDFEAGNATITIAYGARQIVIAADFAGSTVTTVATATGSMTITNQDGVSMSINGDFEASTGDVMFNGTSYATISQMTNGLTKITYKDGTFETL